MVKTQIYLPPKTYKRVREWSLEEDVSMAAIIRDAVEKSLKAENKPKSSPSTLKGIMEIKGQGSKKSSSIIDKVLYGKKAHLH